MCCEIISDTYVLVGYSPAAMSIGDMYGKSAWRSTKVLAPQVTSKVNAMACLSTYVYYRVAAGL